MTKAPFRQNFRVYTRDRAASRRAVPSRTEPNRADGTRVCCIRLVYKNFIGRTIHMKYELMITYFHFPFVGRAPVCFREIYGHLRGRLDTPYSRGEKTYLLTISQCSLIPFINRSGILFMLFLHDSFFFLFFLRWRKKEKFFSHFFSFFLPNEKKN